MVWLHSIVHAGYRKTANAQSAKVARMYARKLKTPSPTRVAWSPASQELALRLQSNTASAKVHAKVRTP